MNTMDNAKVMEVLEKQAMFNYFEKLLITKMRKIVLFSAFPHTGAANLSDPRHLMLIEDPSNLIALNTGKSNN